MTPTILALIVLGLVVADFILDLQLFGFSVALTILVSGILTFYGVTMAYWQWSVLFVALMIFFVVVTRFFIRKSDNQDINKY
jgi:hypothetical protein